MIDFTDRQYLIFKNSQIELINMTTKNEELNN